MNLKQSLSSKILFLIWIIGWGLSFVITGIVGDALRTSGTFVLVMTIIAFIKERKFKKPEPK